MYDYYLKLQVKKLRSLKVVLVLLLRDTTYITTINTAINGWVYFRIICGFGT